MRLFGIDRSAPADKGTGQPSATTTSSMAEQQMASTNGMENSNLLAPPRRMQRPTATRHGSTTIQRGYGLSSPGRNRAATIATPGLHNNGRTLSNTAVHNGAAPPGVVASNSDGPAGDMAQSGYGTELAQRNTSRGENAPSIFEEPAEGGGPIRWAKSLLPGGGGGGGGTGGGGRKRAGTSLSRRHRAPSAGSRLSAGAVDLGLPNAGGQDNLNTANNREDYDNRVQDLLDVIDPEVQVLNTLGDVQNSFFIPYTGNFFNRTRKVQLTKPPNSELSNDRPDRPLSQLVEQLQQQRQQEGREKEQQQQEKREESPRRRPSNAGTDVEAQLAGRGEKELPLTPPSPTRHELDGTVEGPAPPVDTEETVVADEPVIRGKYFVLPAKLVDMSDWTEQEKADLDDYVRHLLHSKKEILKRKRRGFRKYVSTPLGAFVTIYASLLTFWGAAWVLFLIGWLPAGDRQAYFVEICDQILVALFCVTGLGLIPFRIMDTYHAYFVVKYHRKTLKLRQAKGLPNLADENDLPNDETFNRDLEMAGHGQDAVLTDEEQALLLKHQQAFHKSHTYYRPHETTTHHAFPISFLIAIIVLCDFHSIFQLTLGSATWSISYHHSYKKILTTIVLCFSLSCNISGGICIAIGNRRTRKVEVVEALMRQAITQEALRRKEDADAYRAEKKQEQAREQQREKEKQLEKMRRHSEDGLPRTASRSQAAKNKLAGLTRRDSDPGMAREKSLSQAAGQLFAKRERFNGDGSLSRTGSERRLVGSTENHALTSSSSSGASH